MRKIFLVIVCIFGIQISVYSQEIINADNLVGYWEPNKHATQLVIWYDKDGNFKLIEFSTISGTRLRFISAILVGDKLKVKTKSEETDLIRECVYSFVDENTLKCELISPIKDTVIYTRAE